MTKGCVSVVTVTFNSSDELPGLIVSLGRDGGLLREVVAVDNASVDGSADIFERALPGARVIRNSENTGFAAAANQGIEATTCEYVLLVNPDVSFGPGFIEALAAALEADPKAGAAAPLLMRPDGVTVDSAGLVMKKNRKALDRGRDLPVTPELKLPARIFGGCGAAVIYRRSALDDTKVMGEYFDGSFFAYKEDVDLAWRMNLLGWDAVYVPEAVGTHARGWKQRSRKDVPRFVRRHSHKNRYLCMLKNDDPVNILLHLPWFFVYEAQLFGYALFIEPFLFGACSDIINLWGGVFDRRSEVTKRRKRTPREMRKLFG